MAKLNKNTAGFSAVEVVIVLAVVAVLGVVGWVTLHKTAQTAVYRNTEYNFQFEYPKAWGNPGLTSADGKNGKIYDLKWTTTDARAAFATKDYKPNTSGKVIRAMPTLSCQNRESQYVVWLYFDQPGCASAAIWGLPNKTVTESELVVTKKFGATSKLSSIIFAFAIKKDNQGILDKTAIQKLYTDAEKQTAISLAKSIQ